MLPGGFDLRRGEGCLVPPQSAMPVYAQAGLITGCPAASHTATMIGLPNSRLVGMSTTTIKVDAMVRNRLAALAQERGTTMGALLAEMTDRLEREMFFARARDQLVRLRNEHPQLWHGYREESRAWQAGTDSDALSLKDEPGWWE